MTAPGRRPVIGGVTHSVAQWSDDDARSHRERIETRYGPTIKPAPPAPSAPVVKPKATAAARKPAAPQAPLAPISSAAPSAASSRGERPTPKTQRKPGAIDPRDVELLNVDDLDMIRSLINRKRRT